MAWLGNVRASSRPAFFFFFFSSVALSYVHGHHLPPNLRPWLELIAIQVRLEWHVRSWLSMARCPMGWATTCRHIVRGGSEALVGLLIVRFPAGIFLRVLSLRRLSGRMVRVPIFKPTVLMRTSSIVDFNELELFADPRPRAAVSFE